jgi:exonuclease SbcD
MKRSVTFVHAADLHLGATFSGLSSTSASLASKLIDAVTLAFQRVVGLCLSKQVDFLVLAGDSFNEDEVPYRVQHVFFDELRRLEASDIPVYLSLGNHDPEASWGGRLELLPSNVSVFGADAPSYFLYERAGQPLVGLAGRSYAHSREPESLMEGLSRRDLEQRVGRTPFTIGVLHTGLAGSSYAPCTLDDLRAAGFDYWALGHVHARSEELGVPAIMPGSPQGLDINENSRHGCYLVTLEEDCPPQAQFVTTESIGWEQPELDITNVSNLEELLKAMEKCARGLLDKRRVPVCARFTLVGRSPLFSELEDEETLKDLREALEEQFPAQDQWFRVYDIASHVQPMLDYGSLKDSGLFPSVVIERAQAMLDDPSDFEREMHRRLSQLGIPLSGDEIDLTRAISTARDDCLNRLLRRDA